VIVHQGDEILGCELNKKRSKTLAGAARFDLPAQERTNT
jgi:hypothetical protein